MRLYLIRHGQSTNNIIAHQQDFETQRSHDPVLTRIGLQQADLVGEYLGKLLDNPSDYAEPISLTHLYCSPMIRAMQTAQPIAKGLGIHPEIWVDIHEIGGLFTTDIEDRATGFPGLTRQQISEQFPGYQIPHNITDQGWWDVNHPKETAAEFVGRAIKVAMAIKERAGTQERIALVSHAAFFDALIKALLNQSPLHPDILFYNHYNTGITRIDFGSDAFYNPAYVFPDKMRIHYLNRMEHLPVNLRTW